VWCGVAWRGVACCVAQAALPLSRSSTLCAPSFLNSSLNPSKKPQFVLTASALQPAPPLPFLQLRAVA
jgi:hypothetical protein